MKAIWGSLQGFQHQAVIISGIAWDRLVGVMLSRDLRGAATSLLKGRELWLLARLLGVRIGWAKTCI